MNARQTNIEEVKRRTCEITNDNTIQYHSQGNEGVIFTNGMDAYKYFIEGKSTFQNEQLGLIKKTLLNIGVGSFVQLKDIYEHEEELVFRMEFFDGIQYHGGHLEGLRQLLIECKEHGIAYRNIHPKNLLVKDGALKICDIGRSICPMSPLEYREMAKRAYLTYRWHFRENLSELMTQSLSNEHLPELLGFEHFWNSLNEKPMRSSLNELMSRLMGNAGDLKILDCTHEEPPDYDDVSWGNKKFDRVLFNLDTVSEKNKDEVRTVLKAIHRMTEPGGKALLVISNPFDICVRETETHHKELPDGTSTNSHMAFHYFKHVKENGEVQKVIHRPYEQVKRLLLEYGLRITALHETSETDFDKLVPASDYLVIEAEPIPQPPERNVSLLIKVSPIEWETIDFQIKHIIQQLNTPKQFSEIVVVTDDYKGPFLRQYAEPNHEALIENLNALKRAGWIDKVVQVPEDKTTIRKTFKQWFGIETTDTHSENGQHTYTTVYGMNQCSGDYILQMDSDCIITRKDYRHDFIKEMIDVLERDQRALTVSFKVASEKDEGFTRSSGKSEWRTEVRCSMFKRERLISALPLPNSLNSDKKLKNAWHRALDKLVNNLGWHTYRGGDSRVFFVHVPNQMKKDVNLWYNILKQSESGHVPEVQNGNVDLLGDIRDWYEPRKGQFIFIIRGRNVPILKIRRMLKSVEKQRLDTWEIVLIDADSENGMEEYIENVVMPKYEGRMSFWRNWRTITPIENTKIAISSLCSNPESVMITLDADDALIGEDVLTILKGSYSQGVDLTVGSMLRTDKEKEYPVDFTNPRGNRGGNIWQHLRTFKKYLFDAVPDNYFKIDGKWIPQTEDWAFMLPMIDIAKQPVHIKERLYFYEPSPEKKTRDTSEREVIIRTVINMPPLTR